MTIRRLSDTPCNEPFTRLKSTDIFRKIGEQISTSFSVLVFHNKSGLFSLFESIVSFMQKINAGRSGIIHIFSINPELKYKYEKQLRQPFIQSFKINPPYPDFSSKNLLVRKPG